MRSLEELYWILWDEIIDEDYLPSICNKITKLFGDSKIDLDEVLLMKKHFYNQRFLHPEFMTEERNWDKKGMFWWTEKEDENPINRKAFIQKIISTL
jgi:hypothetical protein